jgi:hypothetical protein
LKIEYDKETDALYIQLREAYVEDNIDIEEGITIDLDENTLHNLSLRGVLSRMLSGLDKMENDI